MKISIVIMSVLMALIISKTSDSTYSWSDGSDSGVVVVT